MAIFTAIATAIVTYATGAAVVAGTWAAFAVSVIATGLAAATARLIGGPGARGGSGVFNCPLLPKIKFLSYMVVLFNNQL
jgi:hypothetical protein